MSSLAVVPQSTTVPYDGRRVALSADPFEPQSMEELYKFASLVSSTDFAPKDFRGKPDACFVAMVYGRNLGIGALQSIQNIAVINGRPSTYGTLYWAIVISHPEFEDCVEESDEKQATVTLTRKGRTPKTATFSMQDAIKAGLDKKLDTWGKYPKALLLWRARHIVADFLFADALKGIAPREVVQDYIEGEVVNQDADRSGKDKTLTEMITGTPVVEKVSEDEAREFGKTWKASGWTIGEAKEALKDKIGAGSDKGPIGVSSSLDIPKDRYQEAMEWAKTPKNTTADKSADELKSYDAFKLLDWNEKEQGRFIAQYNNDWPKILSELNILIDKRNAQEA
jgi:hypothetical protein